MAAALPEVVDRLESLQGLHDQGNVAFFFFLSCHITSGSAQRVNEPNGFKKNLIDWQQKVFDFWQLQVLKPREFIQFLVITY